MLTSATAAPSSSSRSLGGSAPFHCLRCHVEPIICSTSYTFSSNWIKAPCEFQRVSEHSCLSFRSENPFFGTTHVHWLPQRHDTCNSQVSVAADYSDSVPDSNSNVSNNGYHPLEELRDHGRVRDTMPSSAEIARTAVEANNRALLIFPALVHCEPHGQISWGEFRYAIDEFGDIYFEVCDRQNILQDQEASNPVTALIGMDISQYESRKMNLYDDNVLDFDAGDESFFADDYFEVDSSKADISVDWGMPQYTTSTHPVYFAKCLTKAINVEHAKLMDHPSNGVTVWGFLKPAFPDEEYYLQGLFSNDDSDGYSSDSNDGDISSFRGGSSGGSTIYRLDITKIELFSVYGVQSVVSVQDFQYSEPDILVHSIPSLLGRFREMGTRCKVALKALCKKKGIHVERANLIGVDSLGMDVRVSSGTEVRTHRFAFKVRVTSECAADKQIQQLLFPRSRRKKLRARERQREIDTC